jgi:hypothetical protein
MGLPVALQHFLSELEMTLPKVCGFWSLEEV